MRIESVLFIALLCVFVCAGVFVGLYVFELSSTNLALIMFVLGMIFSKWAFPYLLRLKREKKQEHTESCQNGLRENNNKETQNKADSIHPLDKLFENLKMTQNVSDPLHISHLILHDKKAFFDFLSTQYLGFKRVPNFAFFQASISHKLRKRDLKAILDICNISLYESESREKFKENLRFVSKVGTDFTALVLEKTSGEILNIIVVNDEIDMYDLSLEIREKFENLSAYPQAKWSNDNVLCLLYDSFRTRYAQKANLELYAGSLESFSKTIKQKLEKSAKKHIIFGYFYRFESPLLKETMNELEKHFDRDLLHIALNSDDKYLRYSLLLKSNADSLQVLFFLDEYDNDGKEYDENYFFDPFLALLEELGEEVEIPIANNCGVYLIKLDSKDNERQENINDFDPKNPQNFNLKKGTILVEDDNSQDLQNHVLRIETQDGSEDCIEIIFPKDIVDKNEMDKIMNDLKTKGKLDSQSLNKLSKAKGE